LANISRSYDDVLYGPLFIRTQCRSLLSFDALSAFILIIIIIIITIRPTTYTILYVTTG